MTRERSVPFLGLPPGRQPGEQTAAVRTPHLDAARRCRVDDGGLGRRYPGEQVRANLHPCAFARLRMAVSGRLCWRPIQARRGAGLDQPRAHARVGARTTARTTGRPRAHPARPKADRIYRRADARRRAR
ncbi:MAG: hypothetical protein LC775_02400, partial [Acidobacteria bacterium]|nr:hypothetical protein [Acidobacteriota bacterium]